MDARLEVDVEGCPGSIAAPESHGLSMGRARPFVHGLSEDAAVANQDGSYSRVWRGERCARGKLKGSAHEVTVVAHPYLRPRGTVHATSRHLNAPVTPL